MTSILGKTLCLAAGLLAFLAAGAAWSRGQDGDNPCDHAAAQAAAQFDVPVNVLRAITRVETGRRENGTLQPWPWAINLRGESHWFADEDEAISFADSQLATGQENFDVGCFQINLRWHGTNFASLKQAFDPQANANYAASFLTDLYASEGGWAQAVAAYHSRTPEKAAIYLEKVEAVLADLADQEPATVALDVPERQNNFPLLQRSAAHSGASLVPPTTGSAPLF